MSALLGRRRSELMIDDATPVEEVVELSEGADEGKESNGMPGGASTSSSMISVRACCSAQWSYSDLYFVASFP